MKAKIVVADDEPRIRAMIALLLKEDGYEVQTAANGQEAVDALLSFRPDVILLDQQMPVLTGVEALEKIKRLCPNQVVVFITAFGSVSLAVDAVKKGASRTGSAEITGRPMGMSPEILLHTMRGLRWKTPRYIAIGRTPSSNCSPTGRLPPRTWPPRRGGPRWL